MRKTRDANDTIIKWLNFSENTGWVYIISSSGRTFCGRFMNDSPLSNQGVGQHCISGIYRLIYQHRVYSDNNLMCFSQGCDCWYQASHCLQHFMETLVTLQTYFSQKMPELS